tara:strand:+ start:2417 stop:3847 length:1431 start_codon:yes stop_codon:yes gene_type:complete
MLLPLLFNLNANFLHEAEGDGGLTLAGSAIISGPFEIDTEFTWQVGEAIERFYRVESKCLPEGLNCDNVNIESDQDCEIVLGKSRNGEQILAIVLARNVSEVCERLRARELIFPIDNIKVYTRPAFKSDRELLESQGADFSCNELVEVPFCTQEECLEFCLDFDLTVDVGATVEGGFAHSYIGTGGLTLGGDADVTSPAYSYVGTGGLTLGGAAEAGIGTYLGEFEVEVKAVVEVSDIGATFGTIDGEPLEPTDDLVTINCDCIALPPILQLSHEINRSNEFSNFLNRNSFSLGEVLPLRYNNVCKIWQHNSQFTGIGKDGITQERWRLVFEWSCADNLGSFDLGNSTVWKFSMYLENKNLSTNVDFDTRILIAFPPQGVCINDFGLNWGFSIDTSDLTVTTDNPAVFVDYKVLQDGIGLFKSQSWLDDPILNLGVSQSTNLKEGGGFNIRPIFPPSAQSLLGDGVTIQNAFVPAG